MPSDVCIIIAAYNAAETIQQIVTGAFRHISHVMVADDGSEDDTARRAAEAGAEIITIEKNMGKGAALKRLFQRAVDQNFEAVITMDADLQHDPEDIPRFIKAHHKHSDHILLGSRMHAKDKIPRARFNSMHIARFFISLAANQFVEDTQCGFRLYPLSLIKRMMLTTDRYVTETEILIKAGDMGARITPVNVSTIYIKNNVSHFRPILDIDAITGYIMSYLWIKWLIEGVGPGKPYTYRANNIRDKIGRKKWINKRFQAFTMLTIFPATVFYWLEYVFLGWIIKNNFASVRKLNCNFFVITLATQMLPVVYVRERCTKLKKKYFLSY